MWSVDPAWLSALAGFRRLVTTVTCTPPDAEPVPLRLTAGTVTVDSGAFVRRRVDLRLTTTAAEFAALKTPGAVLTVETGYRDGNADRLIPVFTGEAVRASRDPETGATTLAASDLGVWLQRSRFLTAFSATVGATRAGIISALVVDARPGTSVLDESGDTGVVGTAATWDEDRTQAIRALATDSELETYFDAGGRFVIRKVRSLRSTPVWTIRPGDGGTLTRVERVMPLDRLYNTVVVRPSAVDGSQTWTQQVVQVTDPTHPRHPDRIGVVPYFWASPTITSAGQAIAAGRTILNRVLGTAETLQLEAIGNPALEAGDVIRVITPTIAGDAADAVTHYIDAFTLDLPSGGMRLSTRSVVDA